MRIIEITGTEYDTEERRKFLLTITIGALTFNVHLDAQHRIDMMNVLAGNGSTARLPIGEEDIFAMIPKGTVTLTCETLNVRKA